MNILILSAATGGGHMRASQALKKYICEHCNDAHVEIIDSLEYISPFLNKTITEGYEQLAKKAPKIFASMYKSTNQDKKLGLFVTSFMAFVSKWLMPIIDNFKPDAIISTHPFSSEMVSNLREVGKIDTPHICILTDYSPHLRWINKYVDSYIVASSAMIDVMKKMGAPTDKIHPFGIPIDDAFYSHYDKKTILEDLGFNSDILTLLIMAGSFGVTDILKIYNNIVNINFNFQIIVITGRNQKLYKAFERRLAHPPKNKKIKTSKRKLLKRGIKLKKIKKRRKLSLRKFCKSKPTKLLYFTNEVEKYMKVSDLIITKPGGLTVSEALACNLPMAIFDAIPGQEEENAEFLIENNMAIKLGKGVGCENTIEQLLKDEKMLLKMKKSCTSFDKSSSNENILFEINRLISEKKL